MASKKQQQEMVQVDRSSSASPFWRTASNSATSPPNKKVIGASYSHADILNFSSLYVNGQNECF
ncbi:RabGAP TBC [Pyrenophora tritici-repentis]|uniref:Uncharacterized protein n=1 Tax=Pyrenophora tritici-repentis TaxID=45151 RepID=A0A2W1EC64_9PLEO|nr:hypothetical protein PtrV1_00146 [Pyrenophora tritici-repentis]KAF7575899.1 hypothetical protein PtrM4_001390 [Pyrenophora tritici-repentis]KAG9377682.1 hypothetical protein A1F94_012085 [Pyrenophora tritici-repentis]KAI0576994.1 hypothetical protein Alg215_07158 [Pyrenophora tritici-repentis]KAI1536319.1 RabGAP TBC [Pyrenophora tritici-repentis]